MKKWYIILAILFAIIVIPAIFGFHIFEEILFLSDNADIVTIIVGVLILLIILYLTGILQWVVRRVTLMFRKK